MLTAAVLTAALAACGSATTGGSDASPHPAGTTTAGPDAGGPAVTIALSAPTSSGELVFSGVNSRPSSIRGQTVALTNDRPTAQVITAATLSGPAAAAFTVGTMRGPRTLAPGQTSSLTVRFTPSRSIVGPVTASLTVTVQGSAPVVIGVYGLAAVGRYGSNEPSLSAVLATVGHPVDVGATTLILGTQDTLLGAEVAAPLFQAAGGPVTLTPVARYSPDEPLPYGWYEPRPAGAAPVQHRIGVLAPGQEQTLDPQHSGGTLIDAGGAPFGLFVHSDLVHRDTSTQEQLNTGPIKHAARVYPLHDRAGSAVRNGYVVAFEDNRNGDYQDYVYVLQGVRPAP